MRTTPAQPAGSGWGERLSVLRTARSAGGAPGAGTPFPRGGTRPPAAGRGRAAGEGEAWAAASLRPARPAGRGAEGGAGPLRAAGALAGTAPRRLVPAPAPRAALPGSRAGGGAGGAEGKSREAAPEAPPEGPHHRRGLPGRDRPKPASGPRRGPAGKQITTNGERRRRRREGAARRRPRPSGGRAGRWLGGGYVAVEEAPPAANRAGARDAVRRHSKTRRQPTMPRAPPALPHPTRPRARAEKLLGAGWPWRPADMRRAGPAARLPRERRRQPMGSPRGDIMGYF